MVVILIIANADAHINILGKTDNIRAQRRLAIQNHALNRKIQTRPSLPVGGSHRATA